MTQPTIQSKQVQHHCSGFGIYILYIYRWYMHGIHWYTRGIRWYTLVYAGVRWYTRGIRAVYARLLWYTRGIREAFVVYGGIRAVYAWYLRGIRWYTLMTPPAPKR